MRPNCYFWIFRCHGAVSLWTTANFNHIVPYAKPCGPADSPPYVHYRPLACRPPDIQPSVPCPQMSILRQFNFSTLNGHLFDDVFGCVLTPFSHQFRRNKHANGCIHATTGNPPPPTVKVEGGSTLTMPLILP